MSFFQKLKLKFSLWTLKRMLKTENFISTKTMNLLKENVESRQKELNNLEKKKK